MNEDFYVGYRPRASASQARFVKRVVVALALFATAVALLLVVAQAPFSDGVFEFQRYGTFEGRIEELPAPSLVVEAPGARAARSTFLLGRFGKRGADELVSGLAGRRGRVEGALVWADASVSLEIGPAGIRPLEGPPPERGLGESLGRVSLVGEIVDSKCHAGVMKPGRGKAHRSCAVRCVSGGVPPQLLVEDDQDDVALFLLVDDTGRVPRSSILPWVGRSVRVEGEVVRVDGQLRLRIDPEDLGPA